MRRHYNGLTLHGVDIETLAHRAAENWQRKHTRLNETDTEDLIAYLVAAAWELSTRYQPGPGRADRFDQYAYPLLTLRCTDWLRQSEGRTRWQFAGHTHERPPREQPLSLDQPAHPDDQDPLAATLADSRSHDAPTTDPDDDRRLLAEALRHQSRDHRTLRQAAARRARNRTPRARAA